MPSPLFGDGPTMLVNIIEAAIESLQIMKSPLSTAEIMSRATLSAEGYRRSNSDTARPFLKILGFDIYEESVLGVIATRGAIQRIWNPGLGFESRVNLVARLAYDAASPYHHGKRNLSSICQINQDCIDLLVCAQSGTFDLFPGSIERFLPAGEYSDVGTYYY
ncbi:hypothetical protein DL764_010772 [Monosporascus ibericus]|uniref:Uncharacterized protein n=1 Tax=Monosporascus ibericus TaxID=155417 RepID=A0A4Q4SS35_9PEZI|nr:hypothetical protein DL764_010772 [Monosporascus ibericus]